MSRSDSERYAIAKTIEQVPTEVKSYQGTCGKGQTAVTRLQTFRRGLMIRFAFI